MFKNWQFKLNNKQHIFAGFWIRFAAFIIDTIFTTIITAPIVLFAIYVLGVDSSSLPTLEQVMKGEKPIENFSTRIINFITWIIAISYSIYFVTSIQKATPGKKICGIYIATKEGKKLSVNQAFIRLVASIFSAFFFGLGFLMIPFTKEKTALHDIVCGSRVFYEKNN